MTQRRPRPRSSVSRGSEKPLTVPPLWKQDTFLRGGYRGASSPNDLILNPLTEDARRAYARRRLFFESSMSARVDRRVHAFLVHISTTMIYTHVLNRGGRGVFGPADRL